MPLPASDLPRRTFKDRLLGLPLRIAIIIAVLAVVAWLIYSLGFPRPNEKYRVKHPAGYSVVRPHDWNARVIFTPNATYRDSIDLAPIAQWKGREPTMWVRRYITPPDTTRLEQQGFIPKKFLSFDGWLSNTEKKFFTTRIAIFHAGNDWFDVGVTLPVGEEVRIEDWWQYMQTFQPAPSAPATQQIQG